MALEVIYIDDELELLEMFRELFSNENIQINTYSETEKGLSAISQSNPDLIILDYRLKDTTGDRLAQRMPANIPKILLSGDLSFQTDSLFLKIFRKPIEMSVMTQFLDQMYQQKEAK